MTDEQLIEQLCRDLNQAHDELVKVQGHTAEEAATLDWPEWTPQANSIRIAEKRLGKRLAKTDQWTNFPEHKIGQNVSGKQTGKRIFDWDGASVLHPGEYAKHPKVDNWYAMTPSGHLGNLGNHDVTEHDDGTITVHPSILVTTRDTEARKDVEAWHGYLEHGIWRQV